MLILINYFEFLNSVFCYSGHERVLEFLLENKANVNHRGKTGWTPIHFAAQNGKSIQTLYIEENIQLI